MIGFMAVNDLYGVAIVITLAVLIGLALAAPAYMWRLHRADVRLARAQGREPLWLPRILAVSLTGIAIGLAYIGIVGIVRILLLPGTPVGHTVFEPWVATTVDLARAFMALSLIYLFVGVIRHAR